MEFRLLGPLEVQVGAGLVPLGGPKQRAALAHLLLRANTLVPADRLIDEVWQDDPPGAARNVLQSYVSRLRKSLGVDRLENRSGGYVLHAETSEVDAHRFEELVRQAARAAAADPESAVVLYREADELWRGPALADLADQPGLRASIVHLEEMRAAALEDRLVLELGLGHHTGLVAELEEATARDPLREAVWGHLMTALYRSGRQADALAAYQRAREALADLGLEPSVELETLQRQVLQHDPALAASGTPLRGFRLLERVGEGSFGVVHRAFQPQVEREVAVKIVRPALADDPDFIRRFEVEAQLVARLEHPHIVPLYDYWREPGGAYLVMRLLRGGSLKDALAGEPLALSQTLSIVEDIGSALASAHRRGVVHRDVKPANILFDEDGNAYLSDFGIARDVTGAMAKDPLGDPSASSSYYLSPEERRGEPPGAWSDVYSLGLVLFEMLAGRHPFAELAPADRASAVVPALADFRGDLPALGDVLERATVLAPADRYQDAEAFVLALREAAEASPATGTVEEPARNPYKGLRPFFEADAPDFFGREALVGRLLARLGDEAAPPLLALVGPSGSGKSSAVLAGLIPAVRTGAIPRSGSWFIATMVPGTDPFASLLDALLGVAQAPAPRAVGENMRRDEHGLAEAFSWALPDGVPLLLVIDQFEELFTLTEREEDRVAFLASLRTAVAHQQGRLKVVLTLRADFLDRPLAYAGFAELLGGGTELVLPLGPEELQLAISGPASRIRVTMEPGLVAQLVSDVVGRPGALPLLQFTLAELFDHRQGGTLGLAAYDEIGGVAGAVARAAEAIYADLSPAGQVAARQLFLRLVAPGDAGETTRRRVLLNELLSLSADAGVMESVIDAFARRRLLSFDRDSATRAPQVELAHEALTVAWDRLRDWFDEAREAVQMQRHLASGAHDWIESGRERSFLIGGARLEQLALWRRATDLALTPVETEFLDHSLARQAKVNRRMRSLLAGLAVLLVVSLVAGGLALRQADRADESAATARDEATRADARRVGEEARATTEIDRALLLAVAGVQLDDTPETRANLLAVLGKHPGLIAPDRVPELPVIGASPDGTSVLTYTDGRLVLRDPSTRTELAKSAAVPLVDIYRDVEFRPDGAQIAVLHNSWNPFATGTRSFAPRPLVLYDAKTLAPSPRQPGGLPRRTAPRSVSFSADGRWLAATFVLFHSADDVTPVASPVLVWDLKAPAAPVIRIDTPAPAVDVELSRDGQRVYITAPPGDLRAYDLVTGRQLAMTAGVGGRLSISADRRTLAVTGLTDGTVTVLDAADLAVRTRLSGHSSFATYLLPAVSADGALVAAPDVDANIIFVWDVVTGAVVEELVGHTEFLLGTWFDPNGRAVHAVTESGTYMSWDLSNSDRFVERRPAPSGLGFADNVLPAVDGTLAYLSGAYGTPEAGGGVQLRTPGADTVGPRAPLPHNGVSALAWNADGSRFATSGDDGTVRVWDPHDLSRPVRERKLADVLIESVAFFPDGRLAVAETNGAAYALDGDTLAETGERVDVGRRLLTVHPGWDDIVLMATGEVSNDLVVVDLAAGQVVETLDAGFLPFGAAASPDASRFAVAGTKGELRVYTREDGWVAPAESADTSAVTSVSWSADGSLVATGGADGGMAVWDGETGDLLGALTPGSVGVPVAPYFAPDNDLVSVAAADGPIFTFSTDVNDWIDFACAAAGRDLTRDEWRETFDDRAYHATCP